MNKAIISVVGKDQIGIIAKVCTYLSDANVNILDISQTILQEYFTMMMIVDIDQSPYDFNLLSKQLNELGESINVSIKLQHEDIFNKMHRL